MRVDHLTIEQGATYEMTWPLTDPSTGQPFTSLTGWTARGQVRQAVAQATVLFEWSTAPDPGEGTILLEDSKLKLQVTPAQSSLWTWRKAVYDVELTSPAAFVTRLTAGTIFVLAEVTR